MTLWCVIPAKPFDEGKSRLAGVVSRSDRRSLCEWLFDRTLRIARMTFGAERILVVSRAKELLARATATGAAGLLERAPFELNAALAQAATAVSSRGGKAMLALSCDLPLLSVSDLRSLTAGDDGRSLVLATDVSGEGTNALLMPLERPIPFAYGPGSRRAHIEAAQAQGLDVLVLRSANLAHDLDTPSDLRWLERGAQALDFRRRTQPCDRPCSSMTPVGRERLV